MHNLFPGSSGHTSAWLDGVSSAVLLTLQPHSPFLLRIPVTVSYETTIPDLAKSLPSVLAVVLGSSDTSLKSLLLTSIRLVLYCVA